MWYNVFQVIYLNNGENNMVELFTNDKYRVLKMMYDNQAFLLGKKVVPLTQGEISSALSFSKMKTNAIFVELQKEGFIVQETRGKYLLTEQAEQVIKKIESVK